MKPEEKEMLLTALDVLSFVLTDNMLAEYTLLEACIKGIRNGDFSDLEFLTTEHTIK